MEDTQRAQSAPAPDLSWLLKQLVHPNVQHVRSALLLSSDGISKSAIGMDKEQTEELAAKMSGLFSLARAAGTLTGESDTVHQVVVELDDHLMFVSAAGSGAILTVVTGREASADQVGFAMAKFIAGAKRFLETPERPAAA
jgi:predicted regulator of Ras-like GTPase activity (Roadblock/LC7/MglB family)